MVDLKRAFWLTGLILVGVNAPAWVHSAQSVATKSVEVEHSRTDVADTRQSSEAVQKALQKEERLDVRLLIDVSQPMFSADPDNTRAIALERLLQALPENGRAGVWIYAEEASEVIPHGISDVFWKRQAVVGVHSLEAQAERSSVFEGLKSVTWDIGQPSSLKRQIVIVTGGQRADSSPAESGDDGALEPGRDEHVAPVLFDVLAEDLAADGTRVHVLNLPGGVPDPGLELLARATGGLHLIIGSPDEIGAAFEQVTLHTSQPPSIPVIDETFRVDPGLREITVRIDGDDPRMTLSSPTGKTLSRARPGSGVRWHDARGFDSITIKRPRPGVWRINSEHAAEVTAWGDLALRVSQVPPRLFPGNLNHVDFMLFNGDRPVIDSHFLDMTRASARLTGQGPDIHLPVQTGKHGLYRVEMVSDIDLGPYVLDVRLEGPTFARKASIPFEMVHPVEVHVAQRGKDLVAWLQLADTAVDPASLKVAAQFRMPPSPRRLVPAERMPGGMWQVTVPKAVDAVELAFSVFGRYQTQKKFELHTHALRVDVPLEKETVFGFDALGRPVKDRDPKELLLPGEDAAEAESKAPAGPVAPPEMELPLWLAIIVALLILGGAGGAFWFLLRKPSFPEFQEWLATRPAAASPEPAAEPQPAT